MRAEPSYDLPLYRIGLGIMALGCIYLGLRIFLHIDLVDYMLPCLFYVTSGNYCPGCGGTRAVLALLRGDIFASLYYHPVVLYLIVFGGWFMISQTIEKLSRGKLAIGMHFRMVYVWVAIAIVTVNFLWKNAVLIITGIPPM